VPLLRDDEVIGIIVIYRQEVRPFYDKQIEVVQNFAAQAVIAIENARLLNELRERTDDLSQRTTDLTEALEQQTATSELLKVISSSPADLQPVFDTMLENATRLCEATHGHVWTFDGEQMYAVAVRGDAPFVKWLRDHNPVRPIPGSAAERIVQGESVVHEADRRDEPAYRDNETFRGLVDTSGIRASLSVALRKEDTLLGMINVYRQDVRPFADNQIKLVEDFAAQAVIAIENARLLNELRQGTTDLTEALDQQTATSEVLQAISASPGDLEPVFAAMLERAVRICDAKFGTLYLAEGGKLRLMAAQQAPAFVEAMSKRAFEPAPGGVFDQAIRSKRTVQIADLAATKPYIERHPASVEAVELGGIRTAMAVPMLKDDELIGVITIVRQEIRLFTNKQIELVTNFAAQAVIAIENTRLLNELRQRTDDLTESLEQQTATSEVLQVISSFPGDLEPVFASMLNNAVRIGDAAFGSIYRWMGGALHVVATLNAPAGYAEARKRLATSPQQGDPMDRLLTSKSVVHVADFSAEPSYVEGRNPNLVLPIEKGGVRTGLLVPMLLENEPIGVFTLFRQAVRPFADKQIALVTNFAAQAVIAIENARLLSELRETLEQQTAPPKSCALSPARPATCSRCLQQCWKTPSASARPILATCISGTARRLILRRTLTRHLLWLNIASVTRSVQRRKIVSVACWRPRRMFR
jgi:GAF domain-containing protein